jgi:hypothetical protein
MKLIAVLLLIMVLSARAAEPEKVCGTYTSIVSFAGQKALDEAVAANPPFLMDKHKRAFAKSALETNLAAVDRARFNTLFMTIYPLWGKDWWAIPAARGLVKDAVAHTRGHVRVHLGLALFTGGFCDNPARYRGASRTIQCDGTRPSWVCFFDDELWKYYTRNVVEMAKLGREMDAALAGIFVDPEAYGPECYLCFCDNCVRKFDAYSGEKMPTGLVKPDAWLHAHGLWEKYTRDWHDAEVRRHANEMGEAIHAVDPSLQLSSLLWDYPVAVGIGDARQGYFRNLAIGLGTKEKPAWTLPEHTYYSDAADVGRIIKQVNSDIAAMGAADRLRVLPGIRVLRQPAATLLERGRVIREADVPGYWMYELADLVPGKTPIDFEGELIDDPVRYLDAFGEMNRVIRGSR